MRKARAISYARGTIAPSIQLLIPILAQTTVYVYGVFPTETPKQPAIFSVAHLGTIRWLCPTQSAGICTAKK